MSVFFVDTAVQGERCELIVSGQIDLCSADEVAALGSLGLTERGVRTLVVRLNGVTFLDSTGLGALIRIRNVALELDKRMVLSQPSERVLRLLEITGLDHVFTIEAGPEAAGPDDGATEPGRPVPGRRAVVAGPPSTSSAATSAEDAARAT